MKFKLEIDWPTGGKMSPARIEWDGRSVTAPQMLAVFNAARGALGGAMMEMAKRTGDEVLLYALVADLMGVNPASFEAYGRFERDRGRFRVEDLPSS